MIASEILKAKILIVDDQEANVALLDQLLSETGYTCVTSTRNPEEVCALHRKNNYDLILLDLQMPEHGWIPGDRRPSGGQSPEGYLPILVITAQPGHKLRALEAGAKDFISKPFELVRSQDAYPQHAGSAAAAQKHPEPQHDAGTDGAKADERPDQGESAAHRRNSRTQKGRSVTAEHVCGNKAVEKPAPG